MDLEGPEPESVRDVVTSSPIHDPLEELDSICTRYDEPVTLEIAEETYADLARGVDTLHTMTCYVDHPLEYFKRTLPGTVFSGLPDGYEAYELTTGDGTIRIKFERSHSNRTVVSTPYDAVQITIPTPEVYFQTYFDATQKRLQENDADGDSVGGDERDL